ncbi:hypothetical protein [Leptobacterium sp. I13]|uniref:hypothetical protein n=1 Tax=Leptobacterium meishanense TaxID=3128904 RepID=UPI0030EDF5F0
MTYQGEYYSNNIYGTSNNHKAVVQTVDGATFLLCELTVTFNGDVWTHTFEAPFFNDEAELYFENYVHSIITQKFELAGITMEDYQFYAFGLASINMKLKEMQQNTLLSELEHDFFMILGRYDALSMDFLTSGVKRLLPVKNTSFLTEQGLLSFSFLSTTLPDVLVVDDGVTESEITLPATATTAYLHTLTIPVKKVVSGVSASLALSLKFSTGFVIELGTFNIIDGGIGHTVFAYQNLFGALSIIEFTGELEIEKQYKTDEYEFVDGNVVSLNTTAIDTQNGYSVNTGYLLDVAKYEMLYSLLKSFNVFIHLEEGLKKMIVNRTQKLNPYRSNYYLNNETLKFKLSKNDDIHYGIF